MARGTEFTRFVEDIFSPMGHVTCRAMFGGYGVYCDGVMFALVADDVLYLKADDATKAQFIEAGQGPFVYEGNGKRVEMSYWRLPEALYENEEALHAWARLAMEAGLRAAQKRKKRPESRL